jgi:hypothetical protein
MHITLAGGGGRSADGRPGANKPVTGSVAGRFGSFVFLGTCGKWPGRLPIPARVAGREIRGGEGCAVAGRSPSARCSRGGRAEGAPVGGRRPGAGGCRTVPGVAPGTSQSTDDPSGDAYRSSPAQWRSRVRAYGPSGGPYAFQLVADPTARLQRTGAVVGLRTLRIGARSPSSPTTKRCAGLAAACPHRTAGAADDAIRYELLSHHGEVQEPAWDRLAALPVDTPRLGALVPVYRNTTPPPHADDVTGGSRAPEHQRAQQCGRESATVGTQTT